MVEEQLSLPETVPCPFCEADIGAQAKKCRHCGEWVSRSCERCATPIRGEWAARGMCAQCQAQSNISLVPQVDTALERLVHRKSRAAAVLCAVPFGALGLHKFYLGKPGKGFIYLFFFWTMIPSLLGLIEGVNYALMGDEEFQRRYSQ